MSLAALLAAFALTSPAFANNAPVPKRYSCDGPGSSPALRWTAPPRGTRSFALSVVDPDVPGHPFTHWLAWGIPASARSLEAGARPPAQGRSTAGSVGYVAPCPPVGDAAHHYVFRLYALRSALPLKAGAGASAFSAALRTRVLATARLTGTYRRTSEVAPVAAGMPIGVGQGPGMPALGSGSVWVPNTLDGTVSRVDPATGEVAATIAGLPPAPIETGCEWGVACGYLDAAIVVGDAVWVSSDYAGLVGRIDAASNQIVERIPVSPRPGGLAAGGGFVWVFHTLRSTISRIDPASGLASSFSVDGARGAGIAYTGGSLWLLTVDPPAVLRLDPQTMAVTARVLLQPFGVRHPFRQAWSLAADDRSLWATNPNYDMVTEIDTGTATVERHVRLPRDQPFGVAIAAREVWVAARTGVVRIDAGSGSVTGDLILPPAGSGYTGVVFGFGAAWVTNFDRGSVTRVAQR